MVSATSGGATTTLEGWIEPDEGELVLFINPTIQGVESAWTELEALEDAVHWRKGALVWAVHRNEVYGYDSIGGFARAVGASYSTLRDYHATYSRLMRLEPVAQATVLSAATLRYSHFRACNGVRSNSEYQRILKKAADKSWSTGKTAEAAQVVIAHERAATQPPLGKDAPTPHAGAVVDLDDFRSRRESESELRARRAEGSAEGSAEDPAPEDFADPEFPVVPPAGPPPEDFGPLPVSPGVIPEDDPESAGEPVRCPFCEVGYVHPARARAARQAATSRPSDKKEA